VPACAERFEKSNSWFFCDLASTLMELRQLEYLVAVVDEGGFTRAAERVHISQSGVSAQIRQLERELGQPLLDRRARVVRPTAAGAAVLPFARAALAAVTGARAALDELTGLLRGRVTVGMVTGCALPEFSAALAAFHGAHPQVGLALVERGSQELVRGVQAGELDLVVAGVHGPPPEGLHRLVLVDEELLLAVPPGHALAGRGPVGLAELAGHPLVCLPLGAGVRSAFDAACAGTAVHVALEASSPAVVLDLAAQGLGVAVVAESMVTGHPGLCAVPLAGQARRSRLEVLWRDGATASPAARALAETVRAHLAGPGTP
jgi:DNA-binding transcriptional LysR family regulator